MYTSDDILNQRCPACGSPDIRMHGTAHAYAAPNGSMWLRPGSPEFRSEAGRVECCACGHEAVLSEGDELLDEQDGAELYAETYGDAIPALPAGCKVVAGTGWPVLSDKAMAGEVDIGLAELAAMPVGAELFAAGYAFAKKANGDWSAEPSA
jgi:hypothetical protein